MDKHKVYVGNLNYTATARDIIEFFSQFGNVVEAMVIPDKFREGKSKGFGFVTFDNEGSVNEAIKSSGKLFMEREIVIKAAKSEGENEKEKEEKMKIETNIYVSDS